MCYIIHMKDNIYETDIETVLRGKLYSFSPKEFVEKFHLGKKQETTEEFKKFLAKDFAKLDERYPSIFKQIVVESVLGKFILYAEILIDAVDMISCEFNEKTNKNELKYPDLFGKVRTRQVIKWTDIKK